MTTLSLPGHSAPAVGFEVPLEMLAACHGRVQHQCETLLRLVSHLRAHGADRAAQEAASAVIRYFDTAARHHHADEEDDLFPALLGAVSGPEAVPVRELTEWLCRDHRLLEQHWAALRQALQPVAEGRSAELDGASVAGFVQRYQQHIAREEAGLLPMATRWLGVAELYRIGLAMRGRRGLVALTAASAPQAEQPTGD